MKILYIAYPLLPVTRNSPGGAEQMLWTLEREMARRGHRTTVAAAAGSQVAGTLVATGDARDGSSFEARCREHNAVVKRLIRTGDFDLVHDKSGCFWPEAAAVDVPVVETLHLARRLCDRSFTPHPRNLSFNLVSRSQARQFSDVPVAAIIENGIFLDHFPFTRWKQEYALWVGRICEEKGPHLAIEAARAAGMPLIIAGTVYPFRYHQEYFAREIAPHVDGTHVRFIESPSFERKVDLLRHAGAVLVPSLVEETSSLISMEAMACGTPIVALRSGALPEVVGPAGVLANDVEGLARGLRLARNIDHAACRERAESLYSSSRMASEYEKLYAAVAEHSLAAAG